MLQNYVNLTANVMLIELQVLELISVTVFFVFFFTFVDGLVLIISVRSLGFYPTLRLLL